jgi:hypothetical protein
MIKTHVFYKVNKQEFLLKKILIKIEVGMKRKKKNRRKEVEASFPLSNDG